MACAKPSLVVDVCCSLESFCAMASISHLRPFTVEPPLQDDRSARTIDKCSTVLFFTPGGVKKSLGGFSRQPLVEKLDLNPSCALDFRRKLTSATCREPLAAVHIEWQANQHHGNRFLRHLGL